MADNRNEFKERKQVEFWKDDLEWFSKTHGDAKLSWIVNLLFHSYREVCEDSPQLPISAASKAARNLKDEIEQGIHKN